MLTNKGKYGLKAMVYLARLDGGATAQSAEIAAAEQISKKFLDAILLDLRNSGFVRSKKGPGGGYALAREAAAVSVGSIIRALDGPLAPIACASRTAYQPCGDCRDLEACAVRLTMLEVRDAMAAVLDNMSLAEMVARSDAVRGPAARIGTD